MTQIPTALLALVAAAGVAALLMGSTAAGRPHQRTETRPIAARSPGWRERRRQRRRYADAVASLPHLVGLIAVGVEAGAPVAAAVTHAGEAHGGPLADRLRVAADAVAWGAEPVTIWEGLADEPALAALGRALGRSARTGASVVRTLETVADDLAAQARAAREDAARQVGVRAAVPLGICLLPAFLLLGIVPLVAGMASALLP